MAILPVVSSAWEDEVRAEAPPQKQVRAFLQSGMHELRHDVAGTEKALLRLRIIIDQWNADKSTGEMPGQHGAVHSSTSIRHNLAADFFSQAFLFGLLHHLDSTGQLPESMKMEGLEIAQSSLRPLERGPNNRAYLFALGSAYAAMLYPDAPEAARWRAYANAVWQDFAGPGDTYEPGYVEHNLNPIIELGLVLGKKDELTGPHLRPAFERFRDHVSATGMVIDPGDGANQSAYPKWLAKYAGISGDGTFRWAAERAIEAGSAGGYFGEHEKRPSSEEALQTTRELLKALDEAGIEPVMPSTRSTVETMFPNTHRIVDRLILCPSREPGSPYAAFYLNDTAETLHHAHEDNRGELFHYEAEGAMLLKRTSWHKWAGQTNTFVVAAARAEFPFPENFGPRNGIWHRADANIRPIRLNQEEKRWKREQDTSPPPKDLKLWDRIDELGYRWDNERGLAGDHDQLDLDSATLSFNTFPDPETGAYNQSASFPDSIRWYRDYRPVAASTDTVVVRIAGLRLTGAAGEDVLLELDKIPANMHVRFFPADGSNSVREIDREQWADWVRRVDDETRWPCLEVTCPPGRLDLVFEGLDRNFDLTDQFSRIGFDYQYTQGAEQFLRTPIAVFLNDIRFRSLYIDHQQGGVLADAVVEDRDRDAYGKVVYDGAWAAQSRWTRTMVLTAEGALIVLDEFVPGPEETDMVGGPVWQLPVNPKRGTNWFAAEADPHLAKGVVVWMSGDGSFGTQNQTKLWRLRETSVFCRSKLEPGKPSRFITVCLPYDSNTDPELTALRIEALDQEGVAEVVIQAPAGQDSAVVRVVLQADDWKVERIMEGTSACPNVLDVISLRMSAGSPLNWVGTGLKTATFWHSRKTSLTCLEPWTGTSHTSNPFRRSGSASSCSTRVRTGP